MDIFNNSSKTKPCYFCKRILHTKGHKYSYLPSQDKYAIRQTYHVCTRCDNILQEFRYKGRLKYLEIIFTAVRMYLKLEESKGTKTIQEISEELKNESFIHS